MYWRRRGAATVSGAERDRVGESSSVEVALEGVAVDETRGLEDADSARPLLPRSCVSVLHVHVLGGEVAGGEVKVS